MKSRSTPLPAYRNGMLFDNSLNDKRFRIDIRTENGYEEGCNRGVFLAARDFSALARPAKKPRSGDAPGLFRIPVRANSRPHSLFRECLFTGRPHCRQPKCHNDGRGKPVYPSHSRIIYPPMKNTGDPAAENEPPQNRASENTNNNKSCLPVILSRQTNAQAREHSDKRYDCCWICKRQQQCRDVCVHRLAGWFLILLFSPPGRKEELQSEADEKETTPNLYPWLGGYQER